MDAECVSNVPAAEVGAAPELVTGLGMAAAAGTELRAGGLAAAQKGWLTVLSPTLCAGCSGNHPMGSSLQQII